MKLFEYRVLYLPPDDWEDEPRVIASGETLAGSDRVVAMRAARAIPEELNLEHVQVVVRPF